MLGKLLKYETKATGRLFLPIYLSILIFALINRLISPFERIGNTYTSNIEGFNFFNMVRMISGFVYFALIIAVIAMTFIIIIQRFYKNLLGDEGYLMFTLPVKPWQHIVSKLLVSMLWTILSFVIIVCSVLILIHVDSAELWRMIGSAKDSLGSSILILIPFSLLIISAYFIITVYNALSIGHLSNKHKILSSFGAYIGIYIVSQIVFSILAFISVDNILIPIAESPEIMPSAIFTLIASLTALYAVLGVVNFLVANTILNRKLNLE